MEIKVTSLHISTRDKETTTVEIKEDTAFRELFDYLGFSKASVNYQVYYPIKDQYFFQKNTIPYIITNGVLKWDLPNSQVKITDFFSTHSITNNQLQVLYGFPHADGPMFPSFLAMWHFFYGVIQGIDPILGVGITLYTAVKHASKRIRKNRVPKKLESVAPSAIFSLVFNCKKWRIYELADLLRIERDEAKYLLKTCGYKWDAHERVYCQSERSKIVLEALNKVRWE